MEQFEDKLRKDLHQFLQSMKEVDERLPEAGADFIIDNMEELIEIADKI